MGMGGAEAVMQLARIRAELDLAGMAVAMRMGMVVTMLVGMGMVMAMIIMRMVVRMPFDSGFAFAAAANSTHRQTPEFIRPTNP
jgi:hypothetical protein